MKTSATAPTVQIKIVLNHEHYAHFVSKLEQDGCNSLTEMYRKAIFNKWPLQNQGWATSSLPVRWRIAGSEDAFRQLAFTQWRENRSDGMPQNPPACFQRKLTATLNAQSAAGGRDGRWVMGDENSVRNNSQAKAQSAAANPGWATSSLPESTKGGARWSGSRTR